MTVDGAQTLLCWFNSVRAALSGVGGKSGSKFAIDCAAFISVDGWDIYSRYLKKFPVGQKALRRCKRDGLKQRLQGYERAEVWVKRGRTGSGCMTEAYLEQSHSGLARSLPIYLLNYDSRFQTQRPSEDADIISALGKFASRCTMCEHDV
jgi:hypothetical protein